MRLFRIPAILLTLLIALALAFAACGGDDDDGGGGGDDGGSASTATATGDSGDGDDDDDGAEETPEDTEDAGGDDDDSGDDDDDGSSAGACEYLTEDEAAAALGDDVSEVVADETGCSWTSDSFSTLVLSVSDLGDSAEESFDGLRRAFEEEDVDGLGDEAMWIPDLQQIHVREGGTYILIGIFLTSQDPDEQKSTAQDVAEKVLGRVD